VIVAKPDGHGTGSRCGVEVCGSMLPVSTRKGKGKRMTSRELAIATYQHSCGLISDAELWEVLVCYWLAQ